MGVSVCVVFVFSWGVAYHCWWWQQTLQIMAEG